MPARLIAVDWGSTNCRATLIDKNGKAIARRDGDAGVFDRKNGDFATQLREIATPWREEYGPVPTLLSGMIGSRNGLVEVPYVTCPAGELAVATALYKVDPSILDQCWIVPGLKGLTPDDVSDVMRGEEVQLFGLLEHPDWREGNGLVLLPGTHSKWALLRDRSVFRFATAASGELFATLSAHGSLAALLEKSDDEEFDGELFRKGLTHARQRGGLSHHLFNLRARAVLGEVPMHELRTRLSALLIGHELEAMLAMFPAAMRVAVVGSESLGRIYCEALAARGAAAAWHSGDDAAASGALRIARSAGLLEV